MPTSCCVPQCNQEGFTTTTGEVVSYVFFPSLLLRRKQRIHAIRREEGKPSKFPQALQRFVHFILGLKIFENLRAVEFTLPMVLFHRSLRGLSVLLHVKEKHLLFASH